MPPPSELAPKLKFGQRTGSSAVEVVSSPERAQYLLIGRWTGSDLEYTWMNKNISEADSKSKWSSDEHGNVCTPDSPYPPRTNWISVGGNSDSAGNASENLTELA